MTGVNRAIVVCGVASFLVIGLCLTSGCGGGAAYEGPERAAVKGSVTFDGSPLAYGTLTFVPAGGEGRRASGLVTDGSYSIVEGQGPNVGKYKVEILGYEKAPATGGEEGEEGEVSEQESSDDEEQTEGESVGAQILPEKYNVATELEVEITSGENTHDFTLTSE